MEYLITIVGVILFFGTVIYFVHYFNERSINNRWDLKIQENPSKEDLYNFLRYEELGDDDMAEFFFHQYLKGEAERLLPEVLAERFTRSA
jgi:hypothetical protein